MKTKIFKSSSRGYADHGWLKSYHTFSFANYHDAERINFGALRVVNDDLVTGGEGFGTHPHDNMEIITIPLYGALAHKDSMGHGESLQTGEVQVMSAGTGITHSEFNGNSDKEVNFFQIWIFPKEKNVEPRYEQKSFDFFGEKNNMMEVIVPKNEAKDSNLWINQDAWINIGLYDSSAAVKYDIKKKGNGVFAMVIDGEFTVNGEKLERRDAIGIEDVDTLDIVSNLDNSRILLIEVPMAI